MESLVLRAGKELLRIGMKKASVVFSRIDSPEIDASDPVVETKEQIAQ